MARPLDPPSAAIVAIDPAGRRTGTGSGAAQREARTARRVSLLTRLVQHRVPETLAHALADDASKLNQGDECRALAAALQQRMRARPIDFVRANAILLKGLHGAGKTSVAAKIAAQAFLTGRKVQILTPDPGAPKLLDLASQLKVRIVAAKTVQSIANAVAEAIRRKSLVVIDTGGFNPRRAKARAAFEALAEVEKVISIGVVSALYDAQEMADFVHVLGAERTIVTGLDLVRRAGALTVAATAAVPIAHVARSPFAGDGLEPLTPLALAQTLLGFKATRS